MSEQILLDESPFGVRALLLDADERPLRLIHRFSGRNEPSFGDVFWARAGERDPRIGMQALNLGSAGEGFLPVKDRSHPPGSMVLVGIRREAIGAKRPLLTDRPSLLLPLARLTPGAVAGPGPMGSGEPPETLAQALTKTPPSPGPAVALPPAVLLLAQLASRQVTGIVTNSGALAATVIPFLPQQFPLYTDDGIHRLFDETTDEALVRRVPLEGGGSLTIDETEALTAIDVDLGHGSGQSQRGGGESLRRRALDTLGRALALRGIGGQVVLDLPRSAVRTPKVLRDQLTAALKSLGNPGVPAVTKEGLAVLVLGQNRRTLLEDLTEEEGDGVFPGRVFRADITAWRAYGLALSVLRQARMQKAVLSVPSRAIPVLEAANALELIRQQTATTVVLKPSTDERITCEEERR